VFNGIFWQHLLEGGLPRRSAGRIALPVAGDDAAGKQIVFDLVDELGFDPVDGGTLAESWHIAGKRRAMARSSQPEQCRSRCGVR
jgi:predicted dinucleotide-binding enzyme